MADEYSHESNRLDTPAVSAFDGDAAKSDAVDLSFATRALYTGTGGTIIVNMLETGSSISFSNVPAGTILPIRASRILATGTTATGLVGLY